MIIGNFNPPSNLLSGALLPSVGSFGFFYQDVNGEYQVYYSSADNLSPPGAPQSKHHKVSVQRFCPHQRIRHHFPEVVSAGCNREFGRALADNMIGTPIHHACDGTTAGGSRQCREWLSGALHSLIIDSEDREVAIAERLLRILDAPRGRERSSSHPGARSIVLIYTDA